MKSGLPTDRALVLLRAALAPWINPQLIHLNIGEYCSGKPDHLYLSNTIGFRDVAEVSVSSYIRLEICAHRSPLTYQQ